MLAERDRKNETQQWVCCSKDLSLQYNGVPALPGELQLLHVMIRDEYNTNILLNTWKRKSGLLMQHCE